MSALEADRAKKRMEQGRPKEGVERIPQDTGKARDFAAAAVGVNPRYVSDAKALKDEAPELLHRLTTPPRTEATSCP